MRFSHFLNVQCLFISVICCMSICVYVYVVQFDQHAELRQQLLDTGDARIVFMCDDGFLGSGGDAKELSESRTYRGKNWLGKSLMNLRNKLQVLSSLLTLFFYNCLYVFSICQKIDKSAIDVLCLCSLHSRVVMLCFAFVFNSLCCCVPCLVFLIQRHK